MSDFEKRLRARAVYIRLNDAENADSCDDAALMIEAADKLGGVARIVEALRSDGFKQRSIELITEIFEESRADLIREIETALAPTSPAESEDEQ